MTSNRFKTIVACVLALAANPVSSAIAFESGNPGYSVIPGGTIPATAGLPSPGLYAFNRVSTRQARLEGPGASRDAAGNNTFHNGNLDSAGLLVVPGWTFLGATYSAVVVQAFSDTTIGPPRNIYSSGIGNTYIAPVELSWKLGDSGFVVKSGLGLFVPDGSIAGPAGLSSAGHAWWTIQPELLVSYFRDGWTLSANAFYEINTANTYTGYRSGDILRVDWQATKKIGQWTIGPVGYYHGQVTSDTSSAYYRGAINVNRFNTIAAGLLVGYDFGPATLNVWATDDLYSEARGGTPRFVGGPDSAAIPQGWKVFAQLSFRILSFEKDAEQKPRFFSK